MSACSRSVTEFLRQRTPLILTKLLTEVGCTKSDGQFDHDKVAKILDLLRHICYGIQIDREEAYLRQLIKHLIEYVNVSSVARKTA